METDELSFCDMCPYFRKSIKKCNIHNIETCRRCRCIECLSPLEQIERLERQIRNLYDDAGYLKYQIREIKKEHNIQD